MVQKVQLIALDFDNVYPRDRHWLDKELTDPVANQVIDLTLFFLRDGFHAMQQSIL